MDTICQYCGTEHDGSYGSGRFCCASCARRYANTFMSEEGRARQIATLTDPEIRERCYDARRAVNETRKRRGGNNPQLKGDSRFRGKQTSLGKVGELVTAKKFIEHGIDVYSPLVDTGVDLVAEFGGKLQKIQVKTTTKTNSEVVAFELIHNKNIISGNSVRVEKIDYDSDKVDYFSLYDFSNDRLFLLKNDEGRKGINIRYTSPKNNQLNKVNRSEDYDFDNVLERILRNEDDDIIEAEYTMIDTEDED